MKILKFSAAIFLLAIGLALSANPAFATDVTLTWTAPTANTDGTTPAKFEGFNIYRVTALPIIAGGTPLAGKSPNAISATTLTYTDKNVAPGTYYYGVTAWHCEAAGCSESTAAVTGSVTVAVTTPSPPTNVQCTFSTTQTSSTSATVAVTCK